MTSGTPGNPWFSWTYLERNGGDVLRALEDHAALTAEAVAIAFVVALPLALVARRVPALAGPILGASAVLYTIPSLALFAGLKPFVGSDRTAVLVGLVTYALLVLVRNILVGLQGIDRSTRDAAVGLGYGPWHLLLAVELPGAIPAVVAGLRQATVTTVALVTVGIVVGYGGLGQLMFRGFRSNYRAEIMTATLLCVVLALAADIALHLVGRALTPWTRTRTSR